MGFVYCFSQEGKYYKIGRSERDSRRRLEECQTGNPHQLTLEWELETERYGELEKYLHYKYKDNWVRGEWFEFSKTELRLVIHDAISFIGDYVWESYAKSVFREMLDFGHVASKSIFYKDDIFYVIEDRQNKKIYTLVDLEKWISEKYTIKEAIIDLGMKNT